jgi:hypothetical protein
MKGISENKIKTVMSTISGTSKNEIKKKMNKITIRKIRSGMNTDATKEITGSLISSPLIMI